MALTNIRYVSHQPDIVIAVYACPPNNAEQVTPLAGSVNSGGFQAQVLKAPSGTTIPGQGYGWGLYDWYTLYPIDANGSLPDVEIRFQVGDRQPNDVVARADYLTQMYPEPRHLRAGRLEQVHQAASLRQLLQDSQGQPISNLPLQIAGTIWIPANQGFAVRVRSQAGWGQSGAAAQAPLVFFGYLDIWTDAELAAYYPQITANTDYGINYGPGGQVSGQFRWPVLEGNPTNPEVLGRFPGGYWQDQITWVLRSAVNAQAIPQAQKYLYTNNTQIQGAQSNNVATTDYDLGYALAGTNAAFVPTLFGLRFDPSLFQSGQPNPQVYLSWAVNGSTVPNPNENGILITAGTNLLQWGATPPILPDQGLFFPVADIEQFVRVLNVRQNMAPQVYTVAAGGIGAGLLRILQAGYLLKPAAGTQFVGTGAQVAA